jgi:hypothetical protein
MARRAASRTPLHQGRRTPASRRGAPPLPRTPAGPRHPRRRSPRSRIRGTFVRVPLRCRPRPAFGWHRSWGVPAPSTSRTRPSEAGCRDVSPLGTSSPLSSPAVPSTGRDPAAGHPGAESGRRHRRSGENLHSAGPRPRATTAAPADTFSMPGTESQKAFDLLEEKFPAANAESATARVVLRAPQGRKLADAKEKAEVENLVARLGKAPEVVAVSDPFEADTLSEDGTTGYAVVTCKAAATELDDKAHDALTAALLGFVPVKVMPRAGSRISAAAGPRSSPAAPWPSCSRVSWAWTSSPSPRRACSSVCRARALTRRTPPSARRTTCCPTSSERLQRTADRHGAGQGHGRRGGPGRQTARQDRERREGDSRGRQSRR